jgi:hypothetical protein
MEPQALAVYAPRVLWLSLEGGLMKFLVRNARGKIVEGAQEKRNQLVKTFKVCASTTYTINYHVSSRTIYTTSTPSMPSYSSSASF